MQVSTPSTKQAIGLCLVLLVAIVGGVPSILPQGGIMPRDDSGGFTLNTAPNPAFKGRNGPAAYLKAMAKYAHLANPGDNKASICKCHPPSAEYK